MFILDAHLDLAMNALEWQRRAMELRGLEAAHAMALQQQLVGAQLAAAAQAQQQAPSAAAPRPAPAAPRVFAPQLYPAAVRD